MDAAVSDLRKQLIEKVLAKQDDAFRWGFDKKLASEHPEYLYYSPNFKSTLWTLILLADLQAPADLVPVKPAIQLIHERFWDAEHGIFRLPGYTRFLLPCLNGNMLYLHHYFKTSYGETLHQTIKFFCEYQRFDDGQFKTPKTFPYCSNIYCYGKHTCYWGVTKLLKGISFLPKNQRSREAQQIIDQCVDFVLHHAVCFSSHHESQLLHQDIGKLTFPNFYKSDFLEILWLLAREEVKDGRITRALDLLRSRRREDGFWGLEKPVNTIVSLGEKNHANALVTERAKAVLEYYGD